MAEGASTADTGQDPLPSYELEDLIQDGSGPMRSFGPRAWSGLWAMAGSLADAQAFDDTSSSDLKFAQYTLFYELKGLYFDGAFEQTVNDSQETAEDKKKLLEQAFATPAQLKMLLDIYCEIHNRGYRLSVWKQGSEDRKQVETQEFRGNDAEIPRLILLNRWSTHWEPVVRLRDPDDLSTSGGPLSMEDSELADDPRVTGTAQDSITSLSKRDWEDAITQGPITSETKLVKLHVPKSRSSEWVAVRNAYRHNCQLVVGASDDGSEILLPLLPEKALRNDRSINISVAFGSMDLAPTIELKAIVYRPDPKLGTIIIHSGRVRFAFGRLIRPKTTDSIDNAGESFNTESGVTSLCINKNHYDDAILISFEYGHGVANQMVPPPHVASQMVAKELDVLHRLKDLARPSQRTTLKLRVLLKKEEMEAKVTGGQFDYLEFLEGIDKIATIHGPPYATHLTRQGFVHGAANSMKNLKTRLEAGDPHMPVKAYAAFLDPIEAEVQFSFDTDSEWVEQTTLLKQFEEDQHWVRFVRFGKNIVALLRIRSREKLFDTKYLLEAGTEVKLQWSSPNRDKEQSALFFVMDDILSFPETDRFLLAKNKTFSYFGSDALLPHQVTKSRTFHKTSLRVVINDVTYKRRMDATHLVWDVRTGRQDLWPLLLNNDPSELPIINPFEACGITSEATDKAIGEALEHPRRPLNSDQALAIRGMRSLTGGFQIVQAPGGVGKTATECILAHTYYKVGICAILTASTNAAVEVVCAEYRTLFPKSPQPVRVLASDRGLQDEVLGRSPIRNDDDTKVASEEILVMEFLSKLKEAHAEKSRSTGNDLLSLALGAAVDNEFQVMRTYVDGIDKTTQEPIPEGEVVDMCEELKKFFLKSTDPTEAPYLDWDDDDKRQYRQALMFVEEEVLLRAPLIACTTSSCAQKLVRQCAGLRFKGIAITLDEASRDREVDTYIPLSKLQRTPIAIHLFGDVKQGLPIHMSSQSHGTNEFVDRGKMPLMNRLIQQGYPYISLKRQYRMHPALFQYPNKRYYDAALITDSSAKLPLKDNLAATLKEILHLEENVPSDHVRLQYIEIHESKVRTSTISHSRANLEHLEWVVEVAAKLQGVFGNRTKQEVMIATPYRRQALAYRTTFLELYRERFSGSSSAEVNYSELPDIRTVDSTQGAEASVVILDLVTTNADRKGDIGHMVDENRACVAFTRAKKVLWVVGGAFRGLQSELKTKEEAEKENPMKPSARARLCSVLEYKRELQRESLYHKVASITLKRPVPKDLDPEYTHAPIDDDTGEIVASSKQCDICKADVEKAEHYVCFECIGSSDLGYIICVSCKSGGGTCHIQHHDMQMMEKPASETGVDEETDNNDGDNGGWGVDNDGDNGGGNGGGSSNWDVDNGGGNDGGNGTWGSGGDNGQW